MSRHLLLIALLAVLPLAPGLADPIHAAADGAYWHHGSGWTFPEIVGHFARVGIPQDVAGSEDAVAHYARVENGMRNTASVDVYQAASAAAGELEARSGSEVSGTVLALSATRGLSAKREVHDAGKPSMIATYFIDAGEWRIRIRITGASLEAMDEFVRGQRWETLGSH